MKVTFQNLGPLTEGTFDLSKKLILLTGRNRMGKSLVAYSLYGMMGGGQLFKFYKIYSSIIDSVIIKGKTQDDIPLTVNINKLIDNVMPKFIERVNANFKMFLGLRNEHFNPMLIGIELGSIQYIKDNLEIICKQLKGISYEIDIKNDQIWFSITNIVIIDPEDFDKTLGELKDIIYHFLFYEIEKMLFFLPAERTFINQVARDLTAYKARLYDRIKYNPTENKEQNDADFSLAVQNYISYCNSWGAEVHEDQPALPIYQKLADERLKNIIPGEIMVDFFGLAVYVENGVPVPYHLTASGIKALTGLDIFLRYSMWIPTRYTIFIDEPELHLHADAQIEFAKLMARMVNAGIQLVVSTHSELIVRQLNQQLYINRTEAKENTAEWGKFCDKFDYTEEDLLTPEQVAVYFFHDGKCDDLPVSQNGFEIPTIEAVLMDIVYETDYFNQWVLPNEEEATNE